MATYVITGASRGLGFAFLRELSNNASNTVIGLVRDKVTTDKNVSEELGGRSNVHILKADMSDYDAIKNAVEETSKITGGSLDYLIANAAYLSLYDSYDPIGVLATKPKELEKEVQSFMSVNVVANIHLYTLFMPLILRGKAKKVIAISSGAADIEMVRKYDLTMTSIYAISKAGLNVVTAKFSAQYRKDGVLFLSICPGMVDVGHYNEVTPEQAEGVKTMVQKFKEYAPHFTGPATPEAAVKDVISVWERCSVENGDGGAYLSHLGNKQWL